MRKMNLVMGWLVLICISMVVNVVGAKAFESRKIPRGYINSMAMTTYFHMPVGSRTASVQKDLKAGTYSGHSTTLFPDHFIYNGETIDGWFVYTEHNTQRTYDGGCYGRNSCTVYHTGEDWNTQGTPTSDHGRPVYAMGDGILLGKGSSSYYGNAVVILHKLPNGEIVLSLYGHMENLTALPLLSKVSMYTKIGEVSDIGSPGAYHLHWEIRRSTMLKVDEDTSGNSDFDVFSMSDSMYGVDYWPTNSTFISNNYYDPTDFIKTHSAIGQRSEYYESNPEVVLFQEAHDRYNGIVGVPTDRGKGIFVYEDCVEEAGEEYCVTRQDYYNSDTHKAYAFILNDLGDEPEIELLQGAILNQYDLEKGPYKYGIPYTGEILAYLAYSHRSKPTDIVVPCEKKGTCDTEGPTEFVLQKFYPITPTGERRGNERRTIGHNPETGATGHFPVGGFKIVNDTQIGLSRASDGNRVYFADPDDLSDMYQWPIYDSSVPHNVVPTNVYYNSIANWYTVSGYYYIKIETADFQPITSIVHRILEGNDQSMSLDDEEDPEPLPPESDSYELGDKKIVQSVSNGSPVGEKYTFTPEDNNVGIWFELANVNAPLDIKVKWFKPDGSQYGECENITKQPTNGQHGIRQWRFLNLVGLSDYGTWKVEVHINDQKVVVKNFIFTHDSDNDGTPDYLDGCPLDFLKIMPGACGCGNLDTDSDGDGLPDCLDAFPNDPSEQIDTDGDGVGDNSDAFPIDPNEWADSDSDGVGDNADAFPADPNEWLDTDNDGVGDNADKFPSDPNESEDSDNDGTGDNSDAFPNDPNEWADTDNDGIGDNADKFPNDANESEDNDNDGIGDNADPDDDNDGIADVDDSEPLVADMVVDTDGDGIPNYAEINQYGTDHLNWDTDADGIADGDEVDHWGNDWDADFDGDGIINLLDYDSDGDSYSDGFELFRGIDPTVYSLSQADFVEIMEDGEDLDTAKWSMFDDNGGTIENVYDDELQSNVIETAGEGSSYDNGYSLLKDGGTWNSKKKNIHFLIRTTDIARVYFEATADNGIKYQLTYLTNDQSPDIAGGTYVRHGLGSRINDGNWHTIIINLQEDLNELIPNVNIVEIKKYLVRGHVRLDNIFLFDVINESEDSDNDGLSNYEEVVIYQSKYNNKDTDADGISDSDEVNYWGSDWDGDIDGDGIINLLDYDSDGNYYSDGFELMFGTDPAVYTSTPDDYVTILEDGEDLDTVNLYVYDNMPEGAEIRIVYDDDLQSNVVETIGQGGVKDNGYEVIDLKEDSWNSERICFNMNIETDEIAYLYFVVTASDGNDYIMTYLLNDQENDIAGDNYIRHGLGSDLTDGNWHTINRNMNDDLNDLIQGIEIISIERIMLRGHVRFDNFFLYESLI